MGDIRGQYHDLLKWFQDCGYPPKAKYLFLGNYVDFGTQSLETICLCFALKIKYPDKFFMLRGKHERETASLIYGFYNECSSRYRSVLWSCFIETMNCMPFAAIVSGTNDKIFCVSGGLSGHLKSMQQIRDIPRPALVGPFNQVYLDLNWRSNITMR